MFSAEFQRNLWLEFSPLRLIAAPGIIGILVGLVFAIGDDSQGTGVTLYEFGSRAAYIALFIWGGWTAAGAVLGEISAQTWELQRMSALGAWSMTWGKLFGSTSYVWYVTAIMLAVAALGQSMGGDTLFDDESDGVLWAVDLVVSGLLVQASAFAAGLLLAGKIRGRQRGSVLMAWIMGLAAGFAAALLTAKIPSITALFELGVIESIYWYDGRYRLENLALFSMVLFTGFAIFAGYRLLRRELQFRSWPWGLPLFALVLIGYVSGFPAARLTPDQSFIGLLSTVALAVAVLFTYLSAFLDRNDPIRYRSLLTAFANGRFKEGLGLLPWWVPQFVLATIATLGILLFSEAGFAEQVEDVMPSELDSLIVDKLWAPALLSLLLRDVAFLLWINMGGRHRRPDLSALVYLALFYGPIQGLLNLVQMQEIAGAFFITPGTSPVVTIFGGLGLAAVFMTLAVRGAKGRSAPVGRREAKHATADGDTPWNA